MIPHCQKILNYVQKYNIQKTSKLHLMSKKIFWMLSLPGNLNFRAKNHYFCLIRKLKKTVEFWQFLAQKFKFTILTFFWKLNFWTQFDIFWQCGSVMQISKFQFVLYFVVLRYKRIIIIQEIRSRFYTIINPKYWFCTSSRDREKFEIIGIRCCLTFWILLRTFREVISCMILD